MTSTPITGTDIMSQMSIVDVSYYVDAKDLVDKDLLQQQQINQLTSESKPLVTYIKIQSTNTLKYQQFTGLQILILSNCSLPVIDLSFNPSLIKVSIEFSLFQLFNIPEQSRLQYLLLNFNQKLSQLHVVNQDSLVYGKFYANNIENISFVKTPNLNYLDFSNNHVSNFNTSGLQRLKTLKCANNKLNILDVCQLQFLENIVLDNNCITQIRGHQFLRKLQFCSLNNTRIQQFFSKMMKNLVTISACHSSLKHFDSDFSCKLQNINIFRSQISSLSLKNNAKLNSFQWDRFSNCCFSLQNTLMQNIISPSNGKLSYKIVDHKFLKAEQYYDQLDVFNKLIPTSIQQFSMINLKIKQLHCCFYNIKEISILQSPIKVIALNYPQLVKLEICYSELEILHIGNLSSKLQFLNISSNKLTAVDLSTCINLTELYGGNNQLQQIILPENLSIIDLNLSNNLLAKFMCNFQSVAKISLASNKLKQFQISALTENLNSLDVSFNILDNLDLQKFSQLKQLNCENNFIEQLDLSHCILLQKIRCGKNLLQTINGINNCKQLKLFCFEQNRIEKLDICKLAQLQTISSTQLIKSEISGLQKCFFLQHIFTENHSKIVKFSTKQLTFEQRLMKSNDEFQPKCEQKTTFSAIQSIDITKITALHIQQTHVLGFNEKFFNLQFLRIESGIFNYFDCLLPELQYLILQSCQLKSVALAENCSKLIQLNLSNNLISYIHDLYQMKNLTMLDLSQNQLQGVQLSDLVNLRRLNLSKNRIKVLGSLKNCRALVTADFSNNFLREVDLPCTIRMLSISQNMFAGKLNLCYCKELRSLSCAKNKIESVDVSACIYLQALVCDSNQISYVAIDGCKELVVLNVSNNKLKQLDVSSFGNLREFHYFGNCNVVVKGVREHQFEE